MDVNNDDLSKLLSSASLVFVAILIGRFATLIERVVISRLLTPSGYGEFSIALSIFTLATMLGVAGFSQGVPRYMARFEATRDIRGAWLSGLVLSLGFSSFIAIGLIVGSPVIVSWVFESDEANRLIELFALAIPIYAVFWIGISAIRGQENTLYKVITDDFGYRIGRILIIIVFISAGFGLVGTALGYVTALLLMTILAYSLLNRLISLQGEYKLHIREMTTFSLPLLFSNLVTSLLTKTDTLMLGYFQDSSEVGIYNAAYPLAMTLTVVLGTFGYLYLPIASRLDSDEDGSVERVYEITTKWIFLIVFPLFLTLLVFSQEIVVIFFGTEYASGGIALFVLTLGFVTHSAVGRSRETLSVLGATTFVLISNVSAFVLNIVLNLILIPIYGFLGAAIASACSFIALNIIVYLILRFMFDITPFNRRSIRMFIALPALLGPPGILLGRHLTGDLLSITLFGIAATFSTILIVVLAGALEPEDAVLIDFMENATGLRVPLIRRYIPDS